MLRMFLTMVRHILRHAMSLVWCYLGAAPGQLGDDSTPQLPDGAIDLLDKFWKRLCLQQGG